MLGCSEKKEQKEVTFTSRNISKKESVKPSPQEAIDTVKSIANLSWHSHVETAFELAKKEHRDVIIMVGEDYCRWCTKMKEGTLTDKRIGVELKKYILVSVKRSDKEAIKYVPDFDGNIPSFFFMTANKEMIEPVVGYFKADDFLEYIKEIDEL